MAIRSIRGYCEKNNTKIHTKEFTINNDEDFIINEIYKENPDLIGFSCYIWNIEMVLSIISTLKKIKPNIKVFLGGPEASYNYEYLFDREVDIVCIGEGEQTVQEVASLFNVEKDITNEFCKIDGIMFKNGAQLVKTKDRELLKLDEIPFVYENNFDDLENRILYYEASRGCPYNCQYCLSSLEKGLRFLSRERVISDLQFFLDKNVKQVKFVDRTFNAHRDFAVFIWNYLIKNDNGITNFHFEISADILTDEMIDLLKLARIGLFQFEIGVQSTNEQTLNEIQRKTNLIKLFEKVQEIQNLKNIHQHLDIIAGLPYEDYEVFKKSFNDVFSLYPEQFQLGFLKLLKGSGLRETADKHGIVYKDAAPYEVIFTKLLDYEKMCTIKNIEELVEIYYNSGKAINTLKYSILFFKTPFDFFEKMAIYWEDRNLFSLSHSKMKLYEVLFEFTKNIKNIDVDTLKEILKLDIILNDNIKSLPVWLGIQPDNRIKQIEREFYNKEENIEKYLPHLKGYDSKQLSRMCYFAQFEINIDNIDFENIEKQTSYALFDYYTKNDLIYKSKCSVFKEKDF